MTEHTDEATAGGRPDLTLTVTDVIPHLLFGGRTNLILSLIHI